MPSSSLNRIEGKGNGSIDRHFITIDLGSSDKTYRNLTLHTPTDAIMDKFLGQMKPLFNRYGVNIDVSKIRYKHPLVKTLEDFKECCDWYNMPEFKQNPALIKSATIIFKIQNGKKKDAFIEGISKLVGEDLKNKTYGWFPNRPADLSPYKGKMFESKGFMPKYPIYIISKGRWERRLTSRYLEWCNIPYKIVVEPQEYDNYAEHINPSKILVLPKKYLNKNQGGIPARNFVMDDARKKKSIRHWILDDNIGGYERLNMNERPLLKGGCVFRMLEDFTDRYKKVKMSGHNYHMFGMNPSLNPVAFNTRIYSSILLSNDIPDLIGEGWRGKYNEDTDLSLRLLKGGFPTILFNNVLAIKETTLTNKGGNEAIYAEKDGLLKKAQSLADQHPDIAKVGERFNRTHHWVDYSKFKDIPLEYKDGISVPDKINNYGMTLVKKVANPIK